MANRTALLRGLLAVCAIPALFGIRAPKPQFVIPAVAPMDPRPLFASEFLPAVPTVFVHGATLAELPNGDLAAAWYGGTDEIRTDVGIYLSILDHRSGRWTPPRMIENRSSAHRALLLPVKSVGNPVLFAERRGLLLFYGAILAGGWSGATICVKSSPDGITWSAGRRVTASPINIGMLVRGAPAAYDDGTIALPVYHEIGAKWGAVARVDRDGHVLDERMIVDPRPVMQPWLVVEGPETAIMLMRYSSREPFCVTLTRTRDAGATWSEPVGTPLVHRDSAVAGVQLDDGSLLVFWNNSAWNRRDLSIARTIDGIHWSKPHPIERDTSPDRTVRHEYSYPFALRTRDGRVHVVYTWRRERIRHIVFNAAWVRNDPILGAMR